MTIIAPIKPPLSPYITVIFSKFQFLIHFIVKHKNELLLSHERVF